MYVTGVNMAAPAEDREKQAIAALTDGQTMMHQPQRGVHHHHNHQQQQQQQCNADDVHRLARIYKSEHVLSDSSTSMASKVRALIDTWNELAVLTPKPSKESLHTLAKFLLTHTLNIVLSVKWMKYKNVSHQLLEQSITACMKQYEGHPEFRIVCTKLLSLIESPWSKGLIKEMLTRESITPSRREYDFFVFEESAYIISMRLKKLCEDKCGDMALNLTRSYLQCCDWAQEQYLSMFISENQKKFVFDIYLSLLYQHGGIVEMSSLLKTMEISAGIDMVRRFASKTPSKLWENNICIAKLSGTIFLTRCVMQPFDESASHLVELLQVWTGMFAMGGDVADEELIGSLRRIIKNALTAGHMYLFIDHLSSRFGLKMRPYCVEIAIQALNTDLNILERFKTENPLRADEISTSIAGGFMRLADQFADNLEVARECVLTAFSVQPTSACFSKIEEMARASGHEVLDTGQWTCDRHPPPNPADEVLIRCDTCGDYMSELTLNPALKQANTSLMEAFKVNMIGLPSVLCDDLVVVLFCVRYQMLSWLQRWPDLQRLCVMYLNDPVGTKNLITDLKFVEIDYTPFMIKKETEEYSGDEYDVIDAEIRTYTESQSGSKRRRIISTGSESEGDDASHSARRTPTSDSAETNEPGRKSDPDVLKTLKTFRRSIKRLSLDEREVVEPSVNGSGAPDVDTTSADGEYEFDRSSSPKPQEEGPPVLLPMIPTSSSLATQTMASESSLSGTNLDNVDLALALKNEEVRGSPTHDPHQEKHRQEFGNFQHDAENYEIDRSPPTESRSPKVGNYCSQNGDGVDDRQPPYSSQNLFEFFKRVYNIKECSILLTRCDRRENGRRQRQREMRFRKAKSQLYEHLSAENSKLVMKPRRKSMPASENVVQSQLVKYCNVNLKLPLRINNRRILSTNNNDAQLEELRRQVLGEAGGSKQMNPVVVLKRLEESCVQSLLARVPGLNDTHLFRPVDTDRIVNVVQVAGGRSTSTQPSTQTSTQVSPHIQRIGQPRNEKTATDAVSNNNTSTETATTTISKTTATRPASSQSSTLINILSQQIIRPTNSNNARARINIISQPTIKTTNTVSVKTATTTISANDTTQLSNTTKIITASGEQQQQILNQIVANRAAAGGTVKAVVVKIGGTHPPPTQQSQTPSTPTSTTSTVVAAAVASGPDANSSLDDSFSKLVAAKPKADGEVETLPKFQQAFGKSVYQSTESTTTNASPNTTNHTDLSNTDNNKQSKPLIITTAPPPSSSAATVAKSVAVAAATTASLASAVNVVQPLQAGVIYTRQMPVGQTINLIQQNRGQVFRIATTGTNAAELVKDSAIHNKMSALLAAALQGKAKSSEAAASATAIINTTTSDESDGGTSGATTTTRVAIARPSLVQSARIVKPVIQIPSNVIRNAPAQTAQATTTTTPTNLSSTTLEQLREFDMVYKQVKERSSSTPADTVTASSEAEASPQRISVTYLNQAQKLNCAPVVVVSSYSSLQPAASPALSVASQGSPSPCVTPVPSATVLPKVATGTTVVATVANKSSKGKTVKTQPVASKTSPIPKPQQKPQEDEHTTQRIFDILAEYAEQLRNSPDLNNKPAPRRRSNPPTNPSQNSKRKKSSSAKKTTPSTLSTDDIDDPRTVGSEDSSCGVVQLSVADDDQTPAAASASESNDSTSHAPPRAAQQLILTDSAHNRNLIIADSSVGEALKMPNTAVLVPGNYIMPVSMVKGGQQIAVVSGGSKILATVPARSAGPNMLLFQSFLNQAGRKTNVVPSTVKYSTIQPISGISSHSLTGVSAQQPVILPPPAHGIGTVTLGQPIAIKKVGDDGVTVAGNGGASVGGGEQLLLTISQPTRDAPAAEDAVIVQPDSSTPTKLDIDENTAMSDHSEKAFAYQKQLAASPIATPVIAQTLKDDPSNDETKEQIITLDINAPFTKVDTPKSEERVQSVLVTAGTSNGPMLSHSPPQYKQSECNNGNESLTTKDEFLRNGGKRNDKVQSAVYCVQGGGGKTKKGASRMDREVQQMCMQRRQAALERELRLQKSLSEECEDLGVDEPSTSDLFPEALLFDANNSPSFDQSSQDTLKRSLSGPLADKDEQHKLSLFADDDDFIFEASQYDANDTQLCYEEVVDARILSNGQGGGDVTTVVAEDTTLLQTCTTMSDVTLSSPISPEHFSANTSPQLNKYMHKYTNKKKVCVKQPADTWSAEVSSSEDTTGSTELPPTDKHGDEDEMSDGGTDGSAFQVVHIALKNECTELHCLAAGDDDDDDMDDGASNGRGARRAIKKTCSCCKGAEDATTLNLNVNANTTSGTAAAATTTMLNLSAPRKRPASAIQPANAHKKAFPSKKR